MRRHQFTLNLELADTIARIDNKAFAITCKKWAKLVQASREVLAENRVRQANKTNKRGVMDTNESICRKGEIEWDEDGEKMTEELVLIHQNGELFNVRACDLKKSPTTLIPLYEVDGTKRSRADAWLGSGRPNDIKVCDVELA